MQLYFFQTNNCSGSQVKPPRTLQYMYKYTVRSKWYAFSFMYFCFFRSFLGSSLSSALLESYREWLPHVNQRVPSFWFFFDILNSKQYFNSQNEIQSVCHYLGLTVHIRGGFWINKLVLKNNIWHYRLVWNACWIKSICTCIPFIPTQKSVIEYRNVCTYRVRRRHIMYHQVGNRFFF